MSNRHDSDYPARDPSSRDSREWSSRDSRSREYGSREYDGRDYGSRDYGSRDQGSRDYGSRDQGSRDYGSRDQGDVARFRDPGRRDERYWQANQQRDDDYSSSDYRSDYRSVRHFDDRSDHRHPSGRYERQDREQNEAGYSAAPFYAAGYMGPSYYGASPPRDAGRYPGRPRAGDRYPDERGTYRERAWSRDPRTGDVHGYDSEARWPASGAGSDAYHQPVRWRSESELGSREGRPGTRSWGAQEGSRFGQYGKGPKGYVRSDERIREDVSDRLSDDDELDASDITVSVVSGEVRLEGTVLDRYSKHRAEDLVEAVSGVRDIANHLRARKGFFQEMGDKLSGDDKSEHRGHAGSGTHNTTQQSGSQQGVPQQGVQPSTGLQASSSQNLPPQNSTKGGFSANR
jgi:hypothetical protein